MVQEKIWKMRWGRFREKIVETISQKCLYNFHSAIHKVWLEYEQSDIKGAPLEIRPLMEHGFQKLGSRRCSLDPKGHIWNDLHVLFVLESVFFFSFFEVLLKPSWFTLWSSLLCKKVTRYMCTDIHPLSNSVSNRLPWNIVWSLCAIEQVPVGQSFHIPQCAYANPTP